MIVGQSWLAICAGSCALNGASGRSSPPEDFPDTGTAGQDGLQWISQTFICLTGTGIDVPLLSFKKDWSGGRDWRPSPEPTLYPE